MSGTCRSKIPPKKGQSRQLTPYPGLDSRKIFRPEFLDAIYPPGVCIDCTCDEEIMNEAFANPVGGADICCWRHAKGVSHQRNRSKEPWNGVYPPPSARRLPSSHFGTIQPPNAPRGPKYYLEDRRIFRGLDITGNYWNDPGRYLNHPNFNVRNQTGQTCSGTHPVTPPAYIHETRSSSLATFQKPKTKKRPGTPYPVVSVISETFPRTPIIQDFDLRSPRAIKPQKSSHFNTKRPGYIHGAGPSSLDTFQTKKCPGAPVISVISETFPRTTKIQDFNLRSPRAIKPQKSSHYKTKDYLVGFVMDDYTGSQPPNTKNYPLSVLVPVRKTSQRKCLFYSYYVIGTFLLMLLIMTAHSYFSIIRNFL